MRKLILHFTWDPRDTSPLSLLPTTSGRHKSGDTHHTHTHTGTCVCTRTHSLAHGHTRDSGTMGTWARTAEEKITGGREGVDRRGSEGLERQDCSTNHAILFGQHKLKLLDMLSQNNLSSYS